jgi:hypothetical protein
MAAAVVAVCPAKGWAQAVSSVAGADKSLIAREFLFGNIELSAVCPAILNCRTYRNRL